MRAQPRFEGDVGVAMSLVKYAGGGYTYICEAAVGTARSTAAWRVMRITDATEDIVYAGTGAFDQVATDLAAVAALTYTLGAQVESNSFTFFVRQCLMRGIGAAEALTIWLDRQFILPPVAQELPHRYLTTLYSSTPSSGPTGDGLLLESGDFLLAENGNYLITEA